MANMNDNSDYNKPRTDLFELLPEVYQSDTNKAVIGNLFNRFLSKQEIEKIAGYIGKGNPNAIVKRQIVEPTLHRQAFQLQPILYDKIGSVEHMAAWKDILSELDRLGVDSEDLPNWGELLQFNWVPPIDIDKLINFGDYYWYDEATPNSKPQYITIRSQCATATANANFWQSIVDEYGETININSVDSVDATLPTYNVQSINSATNVIVVSGDVTAELSTTNFFTIFNSVSNDGIHQVLSPPTFDSNLDETTIAVQPGTISVNEINTGILELRRFDKVVVLGESDRLFDPGFIFFISGSSNVELNGSFWEVKEAEYNETNGTTIITLVDYVTDNTAGGVVSLTEQLNLFLTEKDCQCTGSVGWDLLQWDDNPESPMWGGVSPGDHANLLTAISNASAPVAPGSDSELWFDTTGDKLYQYNGTTWLVIRNVFSLILSQTKGFAMWDSVPGCGVSAAVDTANQWIDENKWFHKSDVPSFSIAKQAQFPIIEYDWDLELNEWTYTDHIWKYRKDRFLPWEETDINPSVIELVPISVWEENPDVSIEELVLDESYGDLSSWFSVGSKFQAVGVDDVFEVEHSSFTANGSGLPYQTRIRITVPFNTSGLIDGATTPIRPYRTSNNDPWKNYGDHWLYVAADNTLPVPHQTTNPFLEINPLDTPTIDPSNDFSYVTSPYAQQYTILTSTVQTLFDLEATLSSSLTSRSLRQRSLIGTDDVRVYINDIRQYGTYAELDDDGDDFVTGINILPGFEPTKFDNIRVEVGEANIKDFGRYSLPVRTEEDNNIYSQNGGYGNGGDITTSLTEYRKVEQVKSKVNQYPLFDIYSVDSTPAYQANALFGYRTSPDADVNAAIGLRAVYDENEGIYDFDQFLIPENNGKMFTYRDYSNTGYDLCFNPTSKQLKFWTGRNWDLKIDVDNTYMAAIVSDYEPSETEKLIDGLYWVDTINNEVFTRDVATNSWIKITAFTISTSDYTLQSIWKKGLNDETYIPEKVDWDGRSLIEYDTAKDLFVTERAEEILNTDDADTMAEAIILATVEWLSSQSNPHSVNGVWVGDWEIPDPLYFNNMNENRKIVNSRELLTHFSTIINAQPKIPGYNGPREAMFHLIATQDVNYGIGGKIRQYTNSFDTMLSSVFVNNVTPRSLITFAHDQYESLLNGIKEIYRKSAVDLLTDTTAESLLDFSTFVANEVITSHEANNNAAVIYGDSTTFTDNIDGEDTGVRNWIATLPYLQLIRTTTPVRIIDSDLGINQVIHHDGHRNDYFLTGASVESIILQTINKPDDRTRFPGPNDPPTDTFGRKSFTDLPPNTVVEFSNTFNTTAIGREGVYWYYSPPVDTRVLYRFTVVDAGDDEPSSTLPDGSVWMDMTIGFEVLRVKITDPITGIADWIPAEGLSVGDGRLHNGTDPADVTTATVSAWVEVNLDTILGNVIFEVEERLEENAPDPTHLRYDFDDTKNNNLAYYNQYLEEAFLDHTTRNGITSPLSNVDYSASFPFSWNYKFSTIGAGIAIVNAENLDNVFTVAGDVESSFNTPGISFYIKNSGVNDGTWTTKVPSAVYDIGSDSTKIYVVEEVTNSISGVLYSGQLPSNRNDGSESGGDWRDYYQKLYGTPFPHLEPWALQDYTNKPDWWDTEYLNNDSQTWGDRTWKYKHGFDITGIDVTTEEFKIDGDFRSVFLSSTNFSIDRSDGIHTGAYVVDNNEVIDTATPGVPGTGSIELTGNITVDYPIGFQFAVVNSAGNLQGLFTVKNRVFTGPPANKTIILTEETIGDVTDFDFISGSTYNSTTNLTSIKVVGDLTNNTIEGRITNAFGMWENIRVGVIPAGRTYSNGLVGVTGIPSNDIGVYQISAPNIPTYNYFSVNIDNHSVSADGGTTTFDSDQIFPPYWNFIGHFGGTISSFDRTIRSIFFNFSTEIVSPGADYSFSDRGPVEWEWSQSSQWLYDQLTIAYRIDPIKYVSGTFGVDFVNIAGLDVDSRLEKVLCHCRTDFHGDVIDSTPYLVAGTNQWYVNFNRYNGYDASSSDFRNLWTQWTAPLTYQFSSFIDTPSLNLDHRYVELSGFDYDIISKQSSGVDDFWIDALDVSVLNIPPALARYDNQLDWRMEINTNLPISRTIEYYDVENFQFYADPNTDLCTLNAWNILDLDTFNDTFTVEGNQTHVFTPNMPFNISGSTGNNGTYYVTVSVYNAVTNETIININDSVNSNVRDGIIVADYRTLPWTTGDGVYLSTAETLPVPLVGDTVNGLTKYFIIVESNNTFKLARTKNDAFNNVAITLTSAGRRDHFIGSVIATFQALNGSRTTVNWRHYKIDKRHLNTISTPYDIQGMQTIVNIVDGYDNKLNMDGWRINEDSSLRDPSSGRLVSWQLELERFIAYAYSLRAQRYHMKDRHEVTVNDVTNVWSFTQNNTQFITGDKINIFSSNNVFPDPFVRGIRYYVIRDSLTTFRLAATKLDAEQGNEITVTSAVGVNKLYLTSAEFITQYAPKHEINPMRNSIWYRPERGIVSNIITGPSEDVRTSQLVFDQFGHPLDIDKLRIFREDKQTSIGVIPGVSSVDSILDPSVYSDIHLGGLHLFVDVFEHVMKFNNYTSENAMIYDPFIGLNVTKFEMLFNRMEEFTGRPNIGGYYLETFFNQGAELKRNIESGAEDLRLLYDSNTVLETNQLMTESRKVLGYEGTRDYLDNLNLTTKSQFLFWKGQIQYKGSVNAVNAFINSRRFIDAKVDDFWAVKIAEFGSAYEKEYPELYVTTTDARSNDFRMQFVDDFDDFVISEDGEVQRIAEDTFTPITILDDGRWFNQPDQLKILRDNGRNLYFDLKVSNSISVIVIDYSFAPLDGIDNQGLVVNGTWNGSTWDVDAINSYFYRWNEGTLTWDNHGEWISATEKPTIRHDFLSDTVSITVKLYADGYKTDYAAVSTLTLAVDPYLAFTGGITVYKQGIVLTKDEDYIETDANTIIFSSVPSADITVVYGAFNLVEGLHYSNVNANVVQLSDLTILDSAIYPSIHDMQIWGMLMNSDAQNPARLLDKSAEVVLSAIQYWDPARGIHNANAIHNIDLQRDSDPAYYNNHPQPDPISEPGYPAVTPWGPSQVGTTWMDTMNMDYFPYYDDGVLSDFESRLRLWGQLAEWSSIAAWEWVKSDVPPAEYDSAAAVDAGDINIPDEQRKSGTVRHELFEKIGSDWILLQNKIETQDAVITGVVDTATTYNFLLNLFIEDDVINVYVDGQLSAEAVVVPASLELTITCNENSRVKFIQLAPTDEDIIEAGIEAGTLLREYEYTKESYYDEFGTELFNYYFWVSKKSVSAINKNRTMTLLDTRDQLVSGPTPYLVYQRYKLPNKVIAEGNRTSNRFERQDTTINQTKILLDTPIAANTVIAVEIDGTPVLDVDLIYSTGDRIVELVNPISTVGLIDIRYVGTFDHVINIPLRFTQAIVRGLRGWIDDDRRYTLRFVRDFTLRDNLDKGTSPLELKDLHEEWEMFRQKQPYHVRRDLWNKITESMVGYMLNDHNVRVPSYERQLYDAKFDTDTRYGLRTGQAFTDGQMALVTILYDLENPENNFRPVDINVFFERNSFDTAENIEKSMNTIYNTFSFEHVNRMLFSVLHDAFSLKDKYPDIIKTSMVALHGIRPFQVGGIFDD